MQADNTCRENKNNNLLRWLASLVCVRRVRSARLCFLMSGHTHEDIDQLWGVLAQHLVHCDELETPEDFQAEMQDFLEKHPRRYEAGRRVRRVDKIHDWKSFLEKLDIQVIGIAGPAAPHEFIFERYAGGAASMNQHGWNIVWIRALKHSSCASIGA